MLEKYKKFSKISIVLNIIVWLIIFAILSLTFNLFAEYILGIDYSLEATAFSGIVAIASLFISLKVSFILLLKLLKYYKLKWLEKNIEINSNDKDKVLALYYSKNYIKLIDVDKLNVDENIKTYIKNYLLGNRIHNEIIANIMKQKVRAIRILKKSAMMVLTIIFAISLVINMFIFHKILQNLGLKEDFLMPMVLLFSLISSLYLQFKLITKKLLKKYVDNKSILVVNKDGIKYLGKHIRFNEIIIPEEFLEFTTKENAGNNNINFRFNIKNSDDIFEVDFVDPDKGYSMYSVSTAIVYFNEKSKGNLLNI